MPTCQNCQMQFSTQGLLYKHQSKFCVGQTLTQRDTYPVPPSPPQSVASSMSIHLPSSREETYRQSPRHGYDRINVRRQLQMEADESGRALDDLKNRNRQLEAQKQEIDKRLIGIRNTPQIPVITTPANGHMLDVRQQQGRNQRQLEELRQQLQNMKTGRETETKESTELLLKINDRPEIKRKPTMPDPDNTNCKLKSLNFMKPSNKQRKNPVKSETSDGDNYEQEVKTWLTTIYNRIKLIQRLALHKKHNQQDGPLTVGADLLPEIIAMRQSYLRQGGSNPSILSQMAEMEAEARAVEARGGFKPDYSRRKKPNNRLSELNDQIRTFELENDRLQNELLLIQERNNEGIRSLRDRDSRYNAAIDKENRLKEQEYLQKLEDLEHEMEVAKKQAQLERLRRELETERFREPIPVSPSIPPPQTRQLYTNPVADVPVLLGNQSQVIDTDPLLPSPYDENAGFMVFYDYAIGLESTTQCVRLVTCLYNRSAQYGEPTVLPNVYCEMSTPNYYSQGTNSAHVGAKQPVPRCPPKSDMALVIELQTASGAPNGQYFHPSRLTTKAWAKLDLFDIHGRVVSGRWRLPLRMTPIKPNLTMNDLNNTPQFGTSEIYIRVVNSRDGDSQSIVQLSMDNLSRYTFPPQRSNRTNNDDFLDTNKSFSDLQATILPSRSIPPQKYSPQEFMSPSPSLPPPSPDTIISMQATPQKRPEYYDYNTQSTTIGFQVDRVRFAEQGLGKVRITAYYKNTGKIVQSVTSPVTCSTTAVKSNFKYKYHVFGQQEATFHEVLIQPDIVILARFYLRRENSLPDNVVNDTIQDEVMEPNMYDDETLVAWGTVPLYFQRAGSQRMNVGTHILHLFEPPVPDPDEVPLTAHTKAKDWRRYNRKASLRLHIFQGTPRPGSLTPSEDSEEEDDSLPDFAWIPYERDERPSDPFSSTDGIDVYIDGCRHLPDNVTISRIAGRAMNRKYEKFGKDVNTSVRLNSDIYNPIYEHKVEFRDPNLPPTLTLLLKIYTIDKFTKKLMIIGFATLNMFVETGTYKQPKTDSGGIQISLNEGGHQLRVYAVGPNGTDPIAESTLRESYSRRVPCASVLVRLIKAPLGRDGRPLEQENIPQLDWGKKGLWHMLPDYNERVYYSMKCKPTPGEIKLLQSMAKRTPVSNREAVKMIADTREAQTLKKDLAIENYVRTVLTKTMDDQPLDVDLTYISQYNPRFGIKVAVDSALNLPWTNFTHATVCLNPPGAFYMGQPQAAYDKLKFTQNILVESTNTGPEWKDTFFEFPYRSYHQYLCVIIHLQEISVTVSRDTYKYGLLEQAWTAIQVFKEGFACTEIYQLPLFHGPPKPHYLRALTREPCKNWIVANVKNKTLNPVKWGSVFVRMCDGRREEEVPSEVLGKQEVKIDTSYLPQSRLQLYASEVQGKGLNTLIPPGKSPQQLVQNLGTKFKSLVYKLYEESTPYG